MNEVRAAHGQRSLRLDPTLARAARSHSLTLLRRNVLEHGALVARLTRFGAHGPVFGENLAWAMGPLARPKAVVRAWLSSPGHRANVLRPGWRRMGAGAAVGTFLGYRGATVVIADFAGS